MDLHDFDHQHSVDLPLAAFDDSARLVAGNPGNPPPLPCVICVEAIPFDEAWVAIVIDDGTVAVVAAHIDRDPDGFEELTCAHFLSSQWCIQTSQLRGSFGVRHDDLRPYHYWLGDHELCDGDPIAVLTGDGAWLAGRYVHQVTSHGLTPLIEIRLGGCLAEPVTIGIPRGALVRTL